MYSNVLNILEDMMNNYDVVGINDAKIDGLVLNIYDYAQRIKDILNNVDDLIYETNNYYNCEEAVKFRNNFESIKDNFAVVTENILSYGDELVRVKNQIYTKDSELASSIKKAAVNAEAIFHEK